MFADSELSLLTDRLRQLAKLYLAAGTRREAEPFSLKSIAGFGTLRSLRRLDMSHHRLGPDICRVLSVHLEQIDALWLGMGYTTQRGAKWETRVSLSWSGDFPSFRN